MGQLGELMPGKTFSRRGDVQSRRERSASAGHPLQNLQRSIGNQAVQRLIRSSFIQATLHVSSPGDQLEQEADRVADAVTRMPDPRDNSGLTISNPARLSSLNRRCSECEKEVGRGPAMESHIERLRGGGRQMPESLRAYFEPRFGHDFGRVRLHTGSDAAEAAQTIDAKAFTVGNDVAFGAAAYSPETAAGRRLLAHELTHVIQQTGGTPGWLHAARQGLTIQRQTGTDYGLARAASRDKYVAEAVRLWTTKKSMKVEDFVNALMKVIETDLLSQGVPELKWQMSPGLGASGQFDSEKWIVSIDPDAFSDRQVTITELKDLTLDEVQNVVGTLYHESRHTDQDVLNIRVLLDQKKAVKDIVQETKIPARIVDAVKATKFKTAPDKAQVAHATRMIAVMYGEHKELLAFLMKNTQVIGGIQALATASDAGALKSAAPHVQELAEWKKNVLEPKVKKLEAEKKGGRLEAQLKRDLGALNRVTARLLAAFAAAVKIKNPTDAGLKGLQQRTDEWLTKLDAAYKNLEGEKDAFAIEESVKKAFKKGATAKPPPAPPKKK
jgi:uncharacterized protein DUF4157